jgi:hypothetical protein
VHQPNFSFSPDGRTLAVLSDERGQFALYLLSIETAENKLLMDVQRCPASDSLDARDKLVELGKDVELLLYEDEGHSFLKIKKCDRF